MLVPAYKAVNNPGWWTDTGAVGASSVVVTANAKRHARLPPLLAAAEAGVSSGEGLTIRAVPAEVVEQAIATWASSDPAAAATLHSATIVVANLPDRHVGLASSSTNTVWLDADAAGYGWFVGKDEVRSSKDESSSVSSFVLHP